MKYILNKSAGQATLFVLLLSLLGLTVVLASVSSSLKNLKQTTQTDFGTKALAGAESALEVGISQVPSSGPIPSCGSESAVNVPLTNFPGFAPGANGNYRICSNSEKFVEFNGIGVDDVATLDGDKIKAQTSNSLIDVLWKGNNSAILVSALYKSGSDNYTLDRFAVNPQGSSYSNNFSPSVAASGCDATTYSECAVSGYTSCLSGIQLRKPPYSLKLLRIRPLYNATDLAICEHSPGRSESLDAQVITITGQAETLDGTRRRVQATHSTSGLPGLFDYSIFTEGDLTK